MVQNDLPGAVTKVYQILEPMSTEDRRRVISGTLALLGDSGVLRDSEPRADVHTSNPVEADTKINEKAELWMKTNDVSNDNLEQVFHWADSGEIVTLASAVPDGTKKEQTANAILLLGVQSLLQNGSPNFSNGRIVEFCNEVGCYDKNNHTANRKSLGTKISGSVKDGFVLPAPGLKAAASLVKSIAD